jgi:hypothetical protein
LSNKLFLAREKKSGQRIISMSKSDMVGQIQECCPTNYFLQERRKVVGQ